MLTKIKKNFYIFLCLTLCLILPACQPIPPNNTESYLELVNSPATTLDDVWYNPGGIFRCAIFESLLISNADMNTFECALAKKYRVSDDGKTYTFDLRTDVQWHDGELFDVHDVLFSIKTALRTNDLNGLIASAFQLIDGANEYASGETDEISGISAKKQTLTIRLISPSSSFLRAIAQFAILPEHILSDVQPQNLSSHDYWKNPIGCGSYRITEAIEGEYFILEANRDYYGKKPGIQKIRLHMNLDNCVKAMQDGLLDFYITNDPEEIAELKGLEKYSEHPLNILFPAYLIVNLSDDEGTNPSLRDVRVRKALLLAIDRDTIIDAIFPGSSVTDTLVPSWDSWYLKDGEDYSFNPQKAKELLEASGFDFSTPLRLRYSAKGQSTADLMNAIAVYWRAIGIQVDLERFDGSGSEHMFNIRDFDVCYKRLSAFNHASIYDEVYGEAVMQTNLLKQPVYDELIEELKQTLDEKVRYEILQEMQILDQQHLLRIPLFALANVAYVNDTHFDMPDAYGNLWYRYDLCFEDWKLVR